MSAVFTPKPYKLSVDDFHRLGEVGILDEDSRVELIEGELIEMAPIGAAHMHALNRLNRLLVAAVGNAGIVSVQNPVRLSRVTEPQPDLAILAPSADALPAEIPTASSVLLLIEVADSTLAYDRGRKLALYARAGIGELWIVNVPAKAIEIYREPAGDGYALSSNADRSLTIAPVALPSVEIRVADVFD